MNKKIDNNEEKDLEELEFEGENSNIDIIENFKKNIENYHGVHIHIKNKYQDDDINDDDDGTDGFAGKTINTSQENLSEIDRAHAKSMGLFNKVCSVLSAAGAAFSMEEIKSHLSAKKENHKKREIENTKENENNKNINKKMKM